MKGFQTESPKLSLKLPVNIVANVYALNYFIARWALKGNRGEKIRQTAFPVLHDFISPLKMIRIK